VFKGKIFLFLILGLIIVVFIHPIRQKLSNGMNFDLSQKDTVVQKEAVYSKGIYISFRTVSTPRVDELLDLIKRTELNTAVIDIKDYTGRIAFDTDNDLINEIGSEQIWIKDIKALVDKFHKEGIYVIARVVVFEDNFLPQKEPYLALKTRNGNLWRDRRGLTWLDPAAEDVWDYIVALTKEAAEAGFDEINLDYIRFPTDGDISNIVYPFWDYKTPKKEIIRRFFEYFSQRVKPLGVFISADLFGLTLTRETDLNIGQWLEDAALYFDYICPMVYPSHYPEGYEGFVNPATHPYEVIYDSLTIGIERLASISSLAKLRPWLQDFDLGANYNAKMINLEKEAVYNAGAYGWLLWNPKNIYTEDALLKE
jgi:hypothetical protein